MSAYQIYDKDTGEPVSSGEPSAIKGSSPLLTFSLRDVIKKCSAAFLGRMSYNVTWGRRLFRRLDYMVDSIKTS